VLCYVSSILSMVFLAFRFVFTPCGQAKNAPSWAFHIVVDLVSIDDPDKVVRVRVRVRSKVSVTIRVRVRVRVRVVSLFFPIYIYLSSFIACLFKR
jgi:hypothetical protein